MSDTVFWTPYFGYPILAGALLACRLFRHKTRKQPFATLLLLTAALQAGALAGFLLG